jgi:hypothetical protein
MDDLDSLINNLNEALAWRGAMGIHQHTRFSEYQNKLVTVQNHRISGKLTELLHTVPLEHYRIAFIESSHLIAIAKTFKRVRGPRFKEKVRNRRVRTGASSRRKDIRIEGAGFPF